MNKFLKIALSFVLAMAATLSNAGDAEAGKALTTACVACHSETGNSPAPTFPNLAGQHENYLLKQLKEIQSNAREVPTMVGQLDNFSETDLANIAAYYASQERAYGAAKAELVELGESIYRFGISRKNIPACTACHSPTGSGNGPANFPALAGQWPEYTVTQLKDFQAGRRHNDGDAGMMRGTALDLNEQEMEAVASYIYGLK